MKFTSRRVSLLMIGSICLLLMGSTSGTGCGVGYESQQAVSRVQANDQESTARALKRL